MKEQLLKPGTGKVFSRPYVGNLSKKKGTKLLKIPPEISGSLETTKVNKEIWTVISLVVGTFDMILQRLNYLVLKLFPLLVN